LRPTDICSRGVLPGVGQQLEKGEGKSRGWGGGLMEVGLIVGKTFKKKGNFENALYGS